MKLSLVRSLRIRNYIPFLKKASDPADGKLSEDQKEKLKGLISKVRTDKPKDHVSNVRELVCFEEIDSIDKEINMDSIRARGFMKYRFNYTPPSSLDDSIRNALKRIDSGLINTSVDIAKIDLKKNLKLKFELLNFLGNLLHHVVPNPELHRMETVGDVIEFYRRPVSNLTTYAQMARDESKSLPGNLHVIEHPARFHPDDKEAYHGGITAFPGRGGEVYGLRNKRLYRQFQPKEHWFDYEEQSFDYTRADKDMPWDPEIAKRMDRFPYKKYNLRTKKFRPIRPDRNEIVS